MARRRVRIAPVGLLGGVLMVVSPFVPSAAQEYHAALVWLGVALWTLGLCVALPKLAWLPALGWLLILAWDFKRMWSSMSPTSMSRWGWLVAVVGGSCVLVASLRALRAKPQTDVSAFD